MRNLRLLRAALVLYALASLAALLVWTLVGNRLLWLIPATILGGGVLLRLVAWWHVAGMRRRERDSAWAWWHDYRERQEWEQRFR